MQTKKRSATRTSRVLAAFPLSSLVAAGLLLALVPAAGARTYTPETYVGFPATVDPPATVQIFSQPAPAPGVPRTFSALESVCFSATFGADNPLGPDEWWGIYLPYGTQFSSVSQYAPVEERAATICLDGDNATDFLDGFEEFQITGPGPFTLTGLTVTMNGEQAPMSTEECRRGGWLRWGDAGGPFKNQGVCLAYLNPDN